MKTKILTIIVGVFLLAVLSSGVATANTLSDVSTTIELPSNVISGDTFTANFSFNYPPLSENYDGSALIIKLNLTSSNQTNYPVWKGDFKIKGYTEKCGLGFFGYCFYPKTIYFSCSEINQTTINHSVFGVNDVDAPDGIFYCFNESNDLELSEKDNVFLNFTPNIALWPGTYTINATLFYLNDTLAPIVNILDKSYFDQYFRDGSDVDFNANISDFVGLNGDPSATIFSSNGSINFLVNSLGNNIYEFLRTLPYNIPEGNWSLIVSATDTSGNIGNDSTILRIDLTGPNISVIQPNETIILSEMNPMLYIEMNITDAKAGVDTGSAEYLLSEMNGTSLCPEDGIGTWDCYSSGWISLPFVDGVFKTQINTTEIGLTSGEYWLRVRAKDILGNVGVLE